MKNIATIIIIFSMLVLAGGIGQSTTWYIQTDGDDTNAGTSWGTSNSYQHIDHAVSNASEGDDFAVGTGTFPEKVDGWTTGGTDGNHAVITGRGAGVTIVTGEDTRTDGFYILGHDYIDVSGFTFQSCTTEGLYFVTGSDNCSISDCTLRDNNTQGMRIHGNTGNTISDNIFEGPGPRGLYSSSSTISNLLVEDNIFRDLSDYGIYLAMSVGTGNVFQRNYIHDTIGGIGIMAGDSTIRSNLIINEHYPIYLWKDYTYEIYNNTLYQTDKLQEIIRISTLTTTKPCLIKNNIMVGGSKILLNAQTAAVKFDYNLTWSSNDDTGIDGAEDGGHNLYSTDPNFTNFTDNTDYVDLTRTSTIPCWGAGTNVGTFADYNGNNFPDPPALGAYYDPEPTPSPVGVESPPPTPYFPTPTRTPTTPTPVPTATSALTPTPQPTATPTPRVITPTPTARVVTPTPTLTPIPTPSVMPTPTPIDAKYWLTSGTDTRTFYLHWTGDGGHVYGPYDATIVPAYINNRPETGGYWCGQFDEIFTEWQSRPARTEMDFWSPPTPTPPPSPTPTPAKGNALRIGNYW